MKYLFSLLFILTALVGFSQGQREATYRSAAGYVVDTVVNTGSKSQISPEIAGYYDIVAVQANLTRISGTAGGSVVLQGSLDNLEYVNIDTLSAANLASQSLLFISKEYPYKYLRATYTGVGTMSVKISTRAIYKRKP